MVFSIWERVEKGGMGGGGVQGGMKVLLKENVKKIILKRKKK